MVSSRFPKPESLGNEKLGIPFIERAKSRFDVETYKSQVDESIPANCL